MHESAFDAVQAAADDPIERVPDEAVITDPETLAAFLAAAPYRGPSRPRWARPVAVGAALVAVLGLAVAPLTAPRAEAAVLPVAPVRVVLDGPTTVVRLTVTATTPTTADGGFGVEVGRPSVHYGISRRHRRSSPLGRRFGTRR